jgi:hypothetical protein
MAPPCLAAVAALLVASGCAHTVTVDSNVPTAAVRVNGDSVGTVADGATFVERWNLGAAYDVEVSAPGHRMARRWVRPNVVDPVAGIASIVAVGGGCVGGGCVLPALALTADDGEKRLLYAGLGAAALAIGAAGSVVLVGGAQRLPDVILVELEPEAGVTDGTDLPPPPLPDDAPGTGRSPAGESPPPTRPVLGGPPRATPGPSTATVRW